METVLELATQHETRRDIALSTNGHVCDSVFRMTEGSDFISREINTPRGEFKDENMWSSKVTD